MINGEPSGLSGVLCETCPIVKSCTFEQCPISMRFTSPRNTVLRGDVNRIVIGRGTNVQDLSMGHVSHKTADKPDGSPLIIGDYVTVGHSVILHGCTIGNECLIGMGSIIMDDVVIPDRVMIGAGSLVSPGKVLESGMLYMGRPAKAVRTLTEEETAYLRYSAGHYIRVKDNYLNGSKL